MSYATEDDEGAPGYAERQRKHTQRILARKWDKMLPIDRTIMLEWVAPPVRGQEAEVVALVGDVEMRHVVGAMMGDGNYDPLVKQYGFNGAAEQWALWKWHTARGTPVDEHTGRVLPEPDFVAPKFEWAAADVEPVKPTRGRPRLNATA